MKMYSVITGQCTRTIKKGFASWTEAYHWALNHDFGQYDEEGGLHVGSYEVE